MLRLDAKNQVALHTTKPNRKSLYGLSIKYKLLVLTLTLLSIGVVAQNHPLNHLNTPHFTFDHTTEINRPFEYDVIAAREGLNPRIGYLYTDSRGIVWIAPWTGGVFQYDGAEVDYMDEQNGFTWDNVNCMTEDKAGNLWFLSPIIGITKCDGVNFEYKGWKKELGNNDLFNFLKKTSGEVYLTYRGASPGIALIEDDTIKPIAELSKLLQGVTIKEFSLDREDNLWIATYGKGLIKYDWKTVEYYNTANKNFPVDSVWEVMFDNTNLMWYIGRYDSIYYHKNGQSTNMTKKYNLPVHINMVMKVFEESGIWVGNNLGPFKLDTNRYMKIGYANNILSTKVHAFEKDIDGNLIFGTSYGLVIERKKKFLEYGNDEGFLIPNKAATFRDDDGKLWIGHDNYFSIIDQGIGYHYKLNSIMKENSVRKIMKGKNGEYYLITFSGLLVIKDKKVAFYSDRNDQFSDNYAFEDMVIDNQGKLFFASRYNGIYTMENDQIVKVTIEPKGIDFFHPQCLFVDKENNLWIGTDGQYIIKRAPDGTVDQGTFGSVNNSVMAIIVDKDGVFWSGSYAGLNVYYDTINFTLSKEDGISGNIINLLMEDNQGDIWIGSFDGLCRLKKPKGFDPANLRVLQQPEVINYSYNDGFKGYSLNRNCSMIDSDGSLWFAAENSFYQYEFKNDSIDRTPPYVQITNISLRRNNLDTFLLYNPDHFSGYEPWTRLPLGLKLPYSENSISLRFRAIKGNYIGDVVYQHRLNGHDKHWSKWEKNTNVIYSNLAPGQYTFEVRAKNKDLIVSEPVLYTFQIITPFYKAWWFILFVCLSFLGLLYYIFRIRVAHLRRQQLKLEKIVQERTRDLENSNRAILAQKSVIEEKNEELNQINEEILSQRDELDRQRTRLEFRNNEIRDSINSAQRIQQAFFQSEDREKELLPAHFAIFKPKDVVSGDFYWSRIVNEYIYISVADCTGHGVPGALMSMLGLSLINEVLNEDPMTGPSNLLTELRDKVIKELNQTSSDHSVKEGMDMSVIRINTKTGNILFAGANNPLYYVSKGELHVIKGSKQPISISEIMRPFEEHQVKLDKGDMIYIFSDGFADQFGGPKGRKMGYRRFREKLEEIHSFPVNEQREHLYNYFESWRGSENQLDDVCVMGIRMG